jgi:type VI secretion system secreted protein Hcp
VATSATDIQRFYRTSNFLRISAHFISRRAPMPTPAYMTIEGATQGLITKDTFTENSVGKIYQEGHENEILVQAFEHQVIRPYQPQSGQPAGSRVHNPLMITKIFDRSSPLLYRALTLNEPLTCTLRWYRPAGALLYY